MMMPHTLPPALPCLLHCPNKVNLLLEHRPLGGIFSVCYRPTEKLSTVFSWGQRFVTLKLDCIAQRLKVEFLCGGGGAN
jgi:hypothetical protein